MSFHNLNDSGADEVRLRYKYRKLILNQSVKMPSRLAMKMVGPDCAYHLYRNHHAQQRAEDRGPRRAKENGNGR